MDDLLQPHAKRTRPGAGAAARGFAAVGSAPRLAVLLALVRAGPDGLTVGAIQKRLGIPASTLAHHLRFLATAELVTQEKRGREIHNRAMFGRIEALAGFLLKECCSETPVPADRRREDPPR